MVQVPFGMSVKEYFQTVKTPLKFLIAWQLLSFAALILSGFNPFAFTIVPTLLFLWIGWSAIRKHRMSVKQAFFSGFIAGLAISIVMFALGIILWAGLFVLELINIGSLRVISMVIERSIEDTLRDILGISLTIVRALIGLIIMTPAFAGLTSTLAALVAKENTERPSVVKTGTNLRKVMPKAVSNKPEQKQKR